MIFEEKRFKISETRHHKNYPNLYPDCLWGFGGAECRTQRNYLLGRRVSRCCGAEFDETSTQIHAL